MKKLLYILLIVPFLQFGCLSVSLDVTISSQACFFTNDSTDLYLSVDGLPIGELPKLTNQIDSLLMFNGLIFPLHEQLDQEVTEHHFIAREATQTQIETVAEGIVSVSSGEVSVSTLKGSFEILSREECVVIVVGQ